MKIRYQVIVLIVVVAMILFLSIPPGDEQEPLIRSLDFGAEDAEQLMRLARAELGDAGWRQKALLMLTVLNRVWHPDYPDSVEDVIRQGGYPSVIDGRYRKAEPDAACRAAIRLIYSGWNVSNNAVDYDLPRSVSGVLQAKQDGILVVCTDSGEIEYWTAPENIYHLFWIGEYVTRNPDGSFSVG